MSPQADQTNSASGAKNIKHKLHSLKSRSDLSSAQLLIFILAFGLIGYFLIKAFAAAPLIASLQGESMVGTTTAGPPQVVSFEAETLSLPAGSSVISDTSASGGNAIRLYSNGTATGSVSFPGSVNSFTVTARGDQCAGAPLMNVSIDGQQLSSTSVASTSWSAYTVTPAAALTSGAHNMSISFTNDYSRNRAGFKKSCDRNLYIDKAVFNIPGTITNSLYSQAVNDAAASNGQVLEFLGGGTATGNFNLPSSATSLTVIAKADSCLGTGANLILSVDGTQLLSTTVSSTSLVAYNATPTLNSGTHSLSITFDNDYYDPGVCDRNLYVDVTNFFGPDVVTSAPSVLISANPVSITAGQASTLTWTSTNTTSCIGSGAWSGNQPTNGSQSTGALNQNTTYTLTCTGSGGTGSDTQLVTVTPVSGGGGSGTGGGSTASVWYPNSAFTTPIPASPHIAPDSAAMISGGFVPLGTNTYNNYWLGPRNSSPGYGAAPAVATANTSTPTVTVQLNFPTCATSTMQVPVPSGFNVGSNSSSENKAVIFKAGGAGEWDFFDITPPNTATYDYTNEAGYAHCPINGNWQSLAGYYFPNGGYNSSTLTPGFSWSDSDFYQAAGIIRQTDITNTPTGGYWNHAVLLDYSHHSDGSVHPRNVFPATTGDGRNSGVAGIPMGARYQLDPSINCDTWPSMVNKAEWLKQMCRTLQVYGMIGGHSASCQGCGDGFWTEFYGNFGGWHYPWQNTDGSVSDYYSPNMNIPADLLSHFRVLDWNWHWAGGNP